jgi:asparagine synthetase B (glutamine-hydrolysing)
MCSFLFTNKTVNGDVRHNKFLINRGPDSHSVLYSHPYTLIHYLLGITENTVLQPFEKNDICLLFNGEIYNYDRNLYLNDTHYIVESYIEHGSNFVNYLDGEFSVCLLDLKKQILVVSSDIFKTKPLFYSIENKYIGISTFKTPLQDLGFSDIKSFEKNKCLVIDLQTLTVKEIKSVYTFNITQYKNSYDDWIFAFEKSIQKRTLTNKNLFIGLSSGYDSGAICCELLKQYKKFNVYSVIGNENDDVLNKRFEIIQNNNIKFTKINKNEELYNTHNNYINKNTEEFFYTINSSSSDYKERIKLSQDGGSNWFSSVCSLAKVDNCLICLSSVGADEIISDYGFNGIKYYNHSNFGGLFPHDLSSIFPWNSFYNSTMESYIAKEEYVGGSYGLEIRYPFLDKLLVQEFLNLNHNLKNAEYKSVISNYLKKNNFPFEYNVKRGF